jgi:hypothetical protein
VFQSGFHRHRRTTAAMLRVTEDIRFSIEDGQVTVLLLLDFSQTIDMVVYELLLCKLWKVQNYLVGVSMLEARGIISRWTSSASEVS